MAGVPVGLDFGAIMLVGAGQGADLELLAQTLPDVEPIVLAGLSGDAVDFEEDPPA